MSEETNQSVGPSPARARTPRMSRLEITMCRRYLMMSEEEIASVLGASPRALIVGEAPGPRTQADCPMFPYPKGSAGHRLKELSDLPIVGYLTEYQRVNLLDEHPGNRWPAEKACERAELLLRAVARLGWPLVLCGNRVAETMCLGDAPLGTWRYLQTLEHSPAGMSWFTWADEPMPGLVVPQPRAIRIPHPSGKNLLMNMQENRALIRKALREAIQPSSANLGVDQSNPERRD